MSHADPAAWRGTRPRASASTRYEPATLRMRRSRIPTNTKTRPTFRSIARRSRASQTAPAKAANARTMTSQLSALITRTASCAVESWSDSSTTSWPASSGIRASSPSPIPSSSLISTMKARRSSVTVPSVVETPSRVSSSRIRRSASCASRLTSSQSSCTRGRCKNRSTVFSEAGAQGRRRPAPRAREVRRQPLLEPGLDVHVRVELVDDVHRQRFPDVVVLEQLRAHVDPGVGVERLPLDPDRERPDEEDQRPQPEQEPGEDRACSRTHPARRVVGSSHRGTIVTCRGSQVNYGRAESPG